MKILAINGSPRGKKSITYLMVESFLKGAKENGAETEHILLSEYNILHCIGCLTCWIKTPGICIFQDDRKKINTSDSDIIIYATPLYADNVSGLLKNFMDRSFSSLNPLMEKDANNEAVHPTIKKTKIIAMSNSGFPGQSNFDVLKVLFRRLARNKQSELIAEIYRDKGPLLGFNDKNLKNIIQNYILLLEKAGKEVVQNLKISDGTQTELEKPLIPHDLYIQNHNAIFQKLKTITS